jgi:hypothetical protein
MGNGHRGPLLLPTQHGHHHHVHHILLHTILLTLKRQLLAAKLIVLISVLFVNLALLLLLLFVNLALLLSLLCLHLVLEHHVAHHVAKGEAVLVITVATFTRLPWDLERLLEGPALPPPALLLFPFEDAVKGFSPAASPAKRFPVAAAALTKDAAK